MISENKKVHIMDSIDILDRVTIEIMQVRPGYFGIGFNCKEHGKVLVIDEKARQTLEHKLLELTYGKDADEKTRMYMEEYVGRWLQKMHKLDLVAIEDAHETEDHYKAFRNQMQ